jgi:hypothetical protein
LINKSIIQYLKNQKSPESEKNQTVSESFKKPKPKVQYPQLKAVLKNQRSDPRKSPFEIVLMKTTGVQFK